MAFNRVTYQADVDHAVAGGSTVDLIAAIAADETVVLGKLSVTLVSDDMAFLYVFKIPSGGSESIATALHYGIPLWPQQIFEDEKIVVGPGEGLAVGILPAPGSGGSPRCIFNAHGDLESGIT